MLSKSLDLNLTWGMGVQSVDCFDVIDFGTIFVLKVSSNSSNNSQKIAFSLKGSYTLCCEGCN